MGWFGCALEVQDLNEKIETKKFLRSVAENADILMDLVATHTVLNLAETYVDLKQMTIPTY